MNALSVFQNAAAHGVTQRDRDELIEASEAIRKLIQAVEDELFYSDPGHKKASLRAALARCVGA